MVTAGAADAVDYSQQEDEEEEEEDKDQDDEVDNKGSFPTMKVFGGNVPPPPLACPPLHPWNTSNVQQQDPTFSVRA